MKKLVLLTTLAILSLQLTTYAQVKNGDMETTSNMKWPWRLNVNNTDTTTPGAATMSYESYEDQAKGHFLQVVVTAANTDKPWQLRVKQNVEVGSDATKITFRARGTKKGQLLRVRYDGNGSTKPQANITLTKKWADYELTLPASSQGTKNTLAFWLKSEGTYQLDDVAVVNQ
ncbi:MAG: hypothetical protein ACPG4E_02895 [Flavobacteriaceae bacterium]